MRVLRSSYYGASDRPPTIAVVTDGQTSDTLESVAHSNIAAIEGDGLVLNDIFEMEGDDLEAAIAEAGKRSHEFGLDERNQVILYFYVLGAWQNLVRPGGISFGDIPAPLSVEQITTVLEQLAKYPGRDGRGYMIPSGPDNKIVSLSPGAERVEVEPIR